MSSTTQPSRPSLAGVDLPTRAACVAEFRDVCSHLRVPPDRLDELARRVDVELLRQLPRFVKMVTVLAYLPELEEQFQRDFRRRGLQDGDRDPLLDAEAQAATAVERVVRAFSGGWCRGNAGAWIARIRDNVLSEALRGVQRQRKRFGRPVATGVLDTLAAPVGAAIPDQPNTPPAVTPYRAVTGFPSARGI